MSITSSYLSRHVNKKQGGNYEQRAKEKQKVAECLHKSVRVKIGFELVLS